MKIRSAVFVLTIISIILINFTGCYSAEGLETLAYAVAIGIDKSDNNKIKLSLQFAIPSNSSSGGESSQSSSSTVTTIDCASIDSGISLVNSYISKKVNLSHCKAVVISEELAFEGVSEYVFTLINNLEIRPDCNIIISRCNAQEYLKNAEPTLESVSARYYELTLNSSEYAGYTQNVTLENFYSNMLSTKTQAHAILGSINNTSSSQSHNDLPIYARDAEYKAGEMPIEFETVLENMGLAVFNDDKLVGELTGMDALSHLLVVSDLESAIITVPNPFNSDSTISLYITSPKKTKTSVKLINGTPYIQCNINISGEILSLDQDLNYSSKSNLDLVEDYTNTYLEQCISSYLYKTSKEFNSDIANFGKYVVGNYATWDEWIESDWLYNYQNSFFSINVDSTISSGQLFTKV